MGGKSHKHSGGKKTRDHKKPRKSGKKTHRHKKPKKMGKNTPNPPLPNHLPASKCQFKLFRPLVLSQFGGKYTKNKKNKKIKKIKTKKGGVKRNRTEAFEPMSVNDKKRIDLCKDTPPRFDKQWVSDNLYLNKDLGLNINNLYIKTWNDHIKYCEEQQVELLEWRLGHSKAPRTAQQLHTIGLEHRDFKPYNPENQVDVTALAQLISNASSSTVEPHEHVFLPDETYDEASDQWTKRCACGFTTEYERLPHIPVADASHDFVSDGDMWDPEDDE